MSEDKKSVSDFVNPIGRTAVAPTLGGELSIDEQPLAPTRRIKFYQFMLVAILLSASAVLVHAPVTLANVGTRNLDFSTHYRWAVQFAEALCSGDPYPHWMWRGNLGFGEVALLFYSPLFYYVCGIVRLFTANTWDAIRIVLVLSTVLTGFYGWRLLKLFMTDGRALIGAVLLQWAPMIVMLFYYFNGFPWAVSFAALVALTYYVVRPGAFECWIDIPISLSVAALALTHLVSALMALICFTSLCLCVFLGSSSNKQAARRIVSWFVSAGVGLALEMFYLLPAVTGRYLISSDVWTTYYTPWNAFIFPTITYLAFGMRWFTFQWPVPAVIVLALVAATRHALARRRAYQWDDPLVLLLVVSWTSIFLASELSYPLWLVNTPLRLVQFPHRFIYVASATAIAANLLALRDIRKNGATGWRTLCMALPLVLGFALTVAMDANMSLFDGKPHRLAVDERNLYVGLAEYQLSTQGPHWRDYASAGGLTAECASRALVCDTLETGSRRQSWRISGRQPTRIRLPLFAFPAWQVSIDGHAVPGGIDPDTGLISVDIPAGVHTVVVIWQRFLTERIGLLITISTALTLAACILARRRRRQREHRLGFTS